ncbi:MAG TPA: hypothetical protein VFV58_37385 [Blastocatellia bacterium]|nr:hypothetical protein [Blastocatellia bacterium]
MAGHLEFDFCSKDPLDGSVVTTEQILQRVARIQHDVLIAPLERLHQGEQSIWLKKRFSAEDGHSVARRALWIEKMLDDLADLHLWDLTAHEIYTRSEPRPTFAATKKPGND